MDGFHIPDGFELKQWTDLDYKIGNGESINEVTERMYKTFTKVFNNNKGKTIMIVCHATSLMSLFRKYADVKINESTTKLELYFNNEMVFDGNFRAPELFKMTFEDDKLIEIKNIKIK